MHYYISLHYSIWMHAFVAEVSSQIKPATIDMARPSSHFKTRNFHLSLHLQLYTYVTIHLTAQSKSPVS